MSNELEIIKCECPFCGRSLDVVWNNGVVSSPDYVLVADQVIHSPCWDKMIEEHPP